MSTESDHLSRPVRIPKALPDNWRFMRLLDCCFPKQWKTISGKEMSASGIKVYGANGPIGYYPIANHVKEVIAIGCRGTCGTIQRIPPPSYVNGNAMCLEGIDSKIVDENFLYHALTYRNVSDAVTGSAQPQITRHSLARVAFPCPNGSDTVEQAAIARILDAVDTAIERTRSVVAEAAELRRAVMRRFFYDALGETAYANRPYKALPDGWKLMPAGELLAEEPKNGVSPKASSQPPGVPTFSIAAVRNGRVDLSGEHLKYAKLRDKVARKFQVARGDLLIVRGNANPDLVGKAGMIADFPEGCIYPDITKRVVFKTDGEHAVTPEYAVLAWNHPIVHNQIVRRAKTSNGTLKINTRDVKQIILPVPTPTEQKTLVALVFSIEAQRDALAEKLTALLQLKKSLMNDLLTGKVRVPIKP